MRDSCRENSAVIPARENPFATRFTDSLPFVFEDGETWDSIFRRFQLLRFKASVIGRKGSGKTTFLLQFAQYLTGKGFRVRYVRVPSIPSPTAGEILIVDGFEQLGFISRILFKWKARRAKGLLLSCHENPPLPVLLHCSTTDMLLRRLVRSLTKDEGYLPIEESKSLLERSKGSIRDALRCLYDTY